MPRSLSSCRRPFRLLIQAYELSCDCVLERPLAAGAVRNEIADSFDSPLHTKTRPFRAFDLHNPRVVHDDLDYAVLHIACFVRDQRKPCRLIIVDSRFEIRLGDGPMTGRWNVGAHVKALSTQYMLISTLLIVFTSANLGFLSRVHWNQHKHKARRHT